MKFLSVLIFTFSMFIVFSQENSVFKYIPEAFHDTTIKNQLYKDLIIYTYDNLPEFDYSNQRDTVVWDKKHKDSVTKKLGMEKIEHGVRLNSVESRKYEDTVLQAWEIHIGRFNHRSFAALTENGYIMFTQNQINEIWLSVDLKKDSKRTRYNFGIKRWNLEYYGDSTLPFRLPNDSESVSYPYQIILGDTSQWDIINVIKSNYNSEKEYISETFEEEQIKEMWKTVKSTSGKVIQKSDYRVNPKNTNQMNLMKFSQTQENKRCLKRLEGQFLFGLWYFKVYKYAKNGKNNFRKLKEKSYNTWTIEEHKNLWRGEGKQERTHRRIENYSYDSSGRLKRVDYKDLQQRENIRFEIYEYGENVFISPRSIIVEVWIY